MRVQVKFYLGQNEDCSLGDSTSDSPGKLLQTDSGEDQEGGCHVHCRLCGSIHGLYSPDSSSTLHQL